jgi:hypothetical protein
MVSGKLRLVAIETALLAVGVGCSALLIRPTPTPPIPTPTRLERERDALQRAYDHATPADAWLVQQEVRVFHPESKSDQSAPACPSTFPVVGVSYGVYYLPADELSLLC